MDRGLTDSSTIKLSDTIRVPFVGGRILLSLRLEGSTGDGMVSTASMESPSSSSKPYGSILMHI